MTAALQIKETDWTATTAYYARYFFWEKPVVWQNGWLII